MSQDDLLKSACNQITQTVNSARDFNEVTERVMTEGAAALGCEAVSVSIRKGGGWIVTHVHGMPPSLVGARMDDDEERHAVLAFETRQPVAVADGFNDGRFNVEHLRRRNIRSVLVVPLILRNEAFGVIHFNYHIAPHAFTLPEVEFAGHLATATAVALENARMSREVTCAKEAAEQKEAALAAANRQLVCFDRAMVSRELRMRELKREIDELCLQYGQPIRYGNNTD